MRTLLKNLFIKNWQRKYLSIAVAIIIWFAVSKSLLSEKTIRNIPVRVENIPPGKTVDGIASNNILNKRTTLTIKGRKNFLDELNENNIEVVFNASGKQGEWIATVSKSNLRYENPDIDLSKGITKVSQESFIIKLTDLMTDKIPILITEPIGEAPKGYQFVDIWPYKLFITISGPEDTVKNLRNRGLKLTFNLSDISKAQLDDIQQTTKSKMHSDVISFYVPNPWKQVTLPLLSANPIEINDPNAKHLRIDFIRNELFKIESPIPIALYFPPSKVGDLSPQKISLQPNQTVENKGGLKLLSEPIYAKGVSNLFLEIFKDMIELAIIVKEDESKCLKFSTQFINAKELEDRYVRALMSDVTDQEIRAFQPLLREEYLRNRFRNYMNRLQFFRSEKEKLDLCPELQGNSVIITETKYNAS